MEALMRRAITSDLVDQEADASAWAADAQWYGPGGIGRATSRAEYAEHFLRPLHAALDKSSASLHVDMLICEANYCGAHFTLVATHVGQWLGVPPTGRPMSIRF